MAPTHTLKLTNGTGTDDLKIHLEVNGVIELNREGQITLTVADETKMIPFRGSIRKFRVIRGAGSASINGTSFQFKDLPGYDTRDGVPREDQSKPEPEPEPEPEKSVVDEATDAIDDLIGDWGFDRKPPHLLELRGKDGAIADYRVTASKELAPTSENGATHDPQDSVQQAGGNWTARGAVGAGRDAYRYGGKRLRFESADPSKLEARVNEGEWQSAAAYGCVQTAGGGGGGGGGDTGSDAPSPTDDSGGSGGQNRTAQRRKLAQHYGIDIQHVERVSSTGEIDGQDNTLYHAPDGLDWDGPADLGQVSNVAVIGDGELAVPAGRRAYSTIAHGHDFLWAGIDLNQEAPGAWGRVHARGERMQVRDITFVGRGRRADPDPSAPLPDGTAGAGIYMPATSPNATNTIEGVTMRHGGVMADRHFGDRPIGVYLAGRHRGTLRIVDSEISQVPNNAIYATACPGRVEIEGCTFRDNGVTCGGRIAHGYYRGCDVSFDSDRDGLANAHAPEHGRVGIAIEQKKAGANGKAPPDIRNCSIRMVKAGKCGGAIRGYDIYRPARIGVIEATDTHIESGAGDATPDMDLPGPVEAARGCTMAGSADAGVSVDNREAITVADNTIDYPDGRGRFGGPTR